MSRPARRTSASYNRSNSFSTAAMPCVTAIRRPSSNPTIRRASTANGPHTSGPSAHFCRSIVSVAVPAATAGQSASAFFSTNSRFSGRGWPGVHASASRANARQRARGLSLSSGDRAAHVSISSAARATAASSATAHGNPSGQIRRATPHFAACGAAR